MPEPRPLRRDRPTLIGSLVLIPALVALFGAKLIFRLFGDSGGRHISVDTVGWSLITFWDDGGRYLVAGALVLCFAAWRRRALIPGLLLGLAGAGMTFVWWLVAILVVVALNPGALS